MLGRDTKPRHCELVEREIRHLSLYTMVTMNDKLDTPRDVCIDEKNEECESHMARPDGGRQPQQTELKSTRVGRAEEGGETKRSSESWSARVKRDPPAKKPEKRVPRQRGKNVAVADSAVKGMQEAQGALDAKEAPAKPDGEDDAGQLVAAPGNHIILDPEFWLNDRFQLYEEDGFYHAFDRRSSERHRFPSNVAAHDWVLLRKKGPWCEARIGAGRCVHQTAVAQALAQANGGRTLTHVDAAGLVNKVAFSARAIGLGAGPQIQLNATGLVMQSIELSLKSEFIGYMSKNRDSRVQHYVDLLMVDCYDWFSMLSAKVFRHLDKTTLYTQVFPGVLLFISIFAMARSLLDLAIGVICLAAVIGGMFMSYPTNRIPRKLPVLRAPIWFVPLFVCLWGCWTIYGSQQVPNALPMRPFSEGWEGVLGEIQDFLKPVPLIMEWMCNTFVYMFYSNFWPVSLLTCFVSGKWSVVKLWVFMWFYLNFVWGNTWSAAATNLWDWLGSLVERAVQAIYQNFEDFQLVPLSLYRVVEDVCSAEVGNINYKEMDPTAKVSAPNRLKCVPGKGLQLIGFGCLKQKPFWPRSCAHNEMCAVRNRCVGKITFKRGRWKAILKSFRYLTNPTEFIDLRPTELSFWLSRYPTSRRQQLMAAFVEWDECAWMFVYGQDAFVKKEITVGKRHHDVDPRLISGPGDLYSVVVGPWIHAAMEALKKGPFKVAYGNPCMIGSGSTPELIGSVVAEYENHGWFVYECDFSRFDSTISEEALEAEMAFYEWCFPFPRHVFELLWKQLKTTGKTIGSGIKFSCDGKRASGVPNTTLGNCILNLMAWFGVVKLGPTVQIMVAGDDSLIFSLVELDMAYIEHAMAQLGFKAKMKKVTYDTLEFCSDRAWRVGETRVMGLKPGRFLCRTMYDKYGLSVKNQTKLLRGMMIGMLPTASFVPIVGTVVDTVLNQIGQEGPIRFDDKYREWRVCPKYHTFDDAAIDQACMIYGITRSDIADLEQYISSSTIPDLLDHPVLDRIIAVDVGTDGEPWEPLEVHESTPWNLGDYLGPVFEEVAKRIHPFFWLLLSLVETILARDDTRTMMYRIIAHFILGWIGSYNLPLAILLHGLHNYCAGSSRRSNKPPGPKTC